MPFATASRWLVLAVCFAVLAPITVAQEADRIPGEVLVRLAPDADPAVLFADDAFAPMGLQPVRLLVPRLNIWLAAFDERAFAGTAVLGTLRAHAAVQAAQYNHTLALRGSEPDDALYPTMWNLHNTGQTGGTEDADVDAPEAWDLTRGGRSAHGDDVVVAIVDNGFDLNHPDLPFWKNTAEIPGNGIDDDANGYVDDYDGWNAYSSTGTISASSHGTHVAGTAAARGNNAEGTTGVNWGAQVMPIQGSSSSEATVVEA
ncbi:MAG: S8 family serine peptidase, partial [Rhodothermales bacterium]|nr:S8 family serine peptidase [Rhodothermales bacterium]